MKDDKVAQLLEKIKNLGEFERDIKQLCRSITETGIDDESKFFQNLELLSKLCMQFSEQRGQIILEMAKKEYTDLKIQDNETRKILVKIREEESFIPDLWHEKLVDLLNKWDKEKVEYSKNYLQNTIYEHLDELREEFELNFSIVDYYDRKLRVGPIITLENVPDDLRNYFSEIREAYVFGLDRSCVSLCRALLDMSLFDKLIKNTNYSKKVSFA